jgi:hypothetical protein
VQEDYTDACWDNHCVFQGIRKSVGRCDMQSSSVRTLSPAWLDVARDWASRNEIATHPECNRVCGEHRAMYGLAFQTALTKNVTRLPKIEVLELSCCLPAQHCKRTSKAFHFLSPAMHKAVPNTTPGEITPKAKSIVLMFNFQHD